MADSETTAPAADQGAEGAEHTTDTTQQEATTQEANDTSAAEGQGEATQEAEGEGCQDANADNAESENNAGAHGEASDSDEAEATEEQAAGEESITSDASQENQPDPQEAQPEAETQPEHEANADQEAAPEPEAEAPVDESQQEAASDVQEQPAAQDETKEDETSAVQLSEEEIARCHRMFDRRSVDGRLDLKGFKVLFRLMGQVLSAQDAETMFEEGDSDDNGTIDFDEFCRLYAKFSEEEQIRNEVLMNSINKLFPDSDGKPVELKKVESLLLKLQQPDLDMRLVREKSDLNANDVRSMVRSMDKNGDGYISKQEFVETLTMHLDMA